MPSYGQVVAGLLAVHVACTIVCQIPSDAFQRFRRLDPFALLPTWRFFAPTPARSDFHLYYRLLSGTDGETEWMPAADASPRVLREILWHPARRTSKSLFDVMAGLMREFPHVDGESIHGSPGYLQVERYTRQLSRAHPEAGKHDACQFAIVTSGGYDDSIAPSVSFASRRIEFEEQRIA